MNIFNNYTKKRGYKPVAHNVDLEMRPSALSGISTRSRVAVANFSPRRTRRKWTPLRPASKHPTINRCWTSACLLLLLIVAAYGTLRITLRQNKELIKTDLCNDSLARLDESARLRNEESGNTHTRHTKSRLLATISPMGCLPIQSAANGKLTGWLVLSAVPTVVTHKSTSNKTHYQLALIGDQRIGGRAAEPKNRFAGKHYAVFPSGEKRQFTKYKSLAKYKSSVSWFCDLPDADATYWHDPANAVGSDRTNVCLTFQIWNDTAHVQTFKSCHNPSVLPSVLNPRNLVFCPNKPAFQKKGKEQYSGFISMLPNIIYHLRHGVDQFTIFIPPINRDKTLRMLELFGDNVTFVFVGSDVPPEKIAPKDFQFRRGNHAESGMYRIGGHDVDAINWLSNDCLNRFRGRARIMKMSHDWDEFHYAPSWRDLGPRWSTNLAQTSLSAYLQPFVDDAAAGRAAYHYARWYTWVKPPDALHSLPMDTRLRSIKYPKKCGKTFIVPDKVAVQWVHWPANCFGTKCKKWVPRKKTVRSAQYKIHRPSIYETTGESFSEYAHFRQESNTSDSQLQRSTDATKALVDDDFFVSETVEVEKKLRDMLKYDPQTATVPFGPLLWLPN